MIAFGIVAEKNSVCRFGGTSGDNPLQRMNETEVEHLVSLVEDENFQIAQRQRTLVDEVEQSAGRCDENVHSARNGAYAFRIWDAAEDHADRQAHVASISLGARGDLRRKLTGRRKDQHSGMAGLREFTGRGEAIERRQHERRGFSGAGLGYPEKIAAGENCRDGPCLDRRSLRIIFRRERIEQGLRKPQGHE